MTWGAIEEAPLRIAIHAPGLPQTGGSNGIITYTGIMRNALRDLGHEVLLLTPHSLENVDGTVVALPRPSPLIGRVRKYLEERRVDDGSNAWVRLRLFDAFRAARRAGVQILEIEESFGWAGHLAGNGVPVVERLHGPHGFVRSAVETVQQKGAGDRREAAERDSLTKVQAVSAPSQKLLDAVSARYGVHPAISRVIPNPMPAAPLDTKWRPDRVDPDQILFVGRFDLGKGADVVLRAFSRAVERRPSLKLVIAGPDLGLPSRSGGVIRFDEFMATEIAPNARTRVRYLGELPSNEITKLRLESALTVVGSRFENFPYGIAEAMALGMPVLTSATFGGSELIREGLDGRIVPIADVHAMGDAIVEMMSNPERLADMGQSAHERVAAWLAPDRIAAETEKLYRAVIAANSIR